MFLVSKIAYDISGCLHGYSHWMWSAEYINAVDTVWLLPTVLSGWSNTCIQKGARSFWYTKANVHHLEVNSNCFIIIGLWIGVVIGLIAQVKCIYQL